MNLRNYEEPIEESKDESYQLTFKGWLVTEMSKSNIHFDDIDKFMDSLYNYAKHFCTQDSLPAIIFQNKNGTFCGVEKYEN